MLFDDIPVKDAIKKRMLKLGQSGKIPHAILFSGKEGSGNLALALAFAQYILCANPSEHDACNACPNCLKCNHLGHPDLFFSYPYIEDKKKGLLLSSDYINEWKLLLAENPVPTLRDWQSMLSSENKKLNIYIAEIRDMAKRLSLKSYSGKAKVMVIWMPELMGKNANALLKLLEEPPQKTYFLLVTENPDKILTTIVSRTQRIQVVEPELIEMVHFIKQMKPEIEEARLNSAAMIAHGNTNKALKELEHIQEPYLDHLRQWLLLCYSGNKHQDLFKLIEELAKKGRENCINFLHYGLELVHKSFLNRHVERNQHLNAEEQNFVTKFATLLNAGAFETLYRILNDCIASVEQNGNIKIVLNHASIQINTIFKQKREE